MRMAKAYLDYRLRAKKLHGVHSPFVYDLSEKAIHQRGAKNAEAIENMRKKLLANPSKITIVDYGAGSRTGASNDRTISSIAKASSTSIKMAQLIQRVISHLNLEHVLELGTNLGLTTAYLASAENRPQVWSLEGDPTLAALAVKNLQNLRLYAEIKVGKFEDTLALALSEMRRVDFAYLDGNHRKNPTLDYFERILHLCGENSVLAVGDIYWSKEMNEAWEEIKQHEQVTLTIDLFELGLVFFRNDRQQTEHFTIKP
jgi:predicted O-methyltransferase YrrM